MAKNVDIKKKCPRENIINGTCQDNPQIGARKDIVTGAPDYEYCTHSFLTTWIIGLKYGNRSLQIEDEKSRSPKQFENKHSRLEVVTTYYHRTHNSSRQYIGTPLILGVKETRGGNYEWYENSGGGIKWKTISNTAEFPSNDTGQVSSRFKDKLDRLACKLQGIVEIDLSKNKDEEYCHNHDGGIYTKRIKVGLNPDIFDFPKYVTFDHIPNPQIYGTTELTIGGFNIGGTPQNVSGLHFPVTRVKRVTVFMPACDHNNPFLFHIESEDNNNSGKWFKNSDRNDWVEYRTLNAQIPDKANEQVKQSFQQLTSGLGIKFCGISGEVKLDITKIPSSGRTETIYFFDGTPILVKKENPNNIPKVFLKYAHIPVTDNSNTFTVSTTSLKGDQIGSGKHKKVKKFFVYFWEGETSKPILLGITKGGGQPNYYGKRTSVNSYWMLQPVAGMNEIEALDDQNCNRNGAIPFDIKEPTNPSQFLSSSKQYSCINTTRKITGPRSPVTIPGYGVKEYGVNNNDNSLFGNAISTKISRVIYGGADTTGIKLPIGYAVYKIRVYSHGPTSILLMVQFIKQGGDDSMWYYSQRSSGTQWGSAGKEKSQKFYKGDEPTEKLTTELDDVRCLRDNEVTMNLSLSNSKIHAKGGNKYCCEKHSETERRVTVTSGKAGNDSQEIPFYKHEIGVGTELAGIKYYDEKTRKNITSNNGLRFPIQGSLSVYAFYCTGKAPVLIYVNGTGTKSVTGWYKKSSGDDQPWVRLNGELPDKIPDNIKDCGEKTQLLEQLGRLGCSNSWHCSQSSGSITTVQVTHRTTQPGASHQPGPGKDGKVLVPHPPSGIDGSAPGQAKPEVQSPVDKSLEDSQQEHVKSDLATKNQGGGQGPDAGISSSRPTVTLGPEAPSQAAQPSESEPFVLESATSIGVIASSVFGGSGLTGFLGYKGYNLYKNFKGDPWVIHLYPIEFLKNVPY